MCHHCTRHFECKRHLINGYYGANIKSLLSVVQASCYLSRFPMGNTLTFFLLKEGTEMHRSEVTCLKFHIEEESGMRALDSLLLPTQQFHQKKAVSTLSHALPEFTEVHLGTLTIRKTGDYSETLDWLRMQDEWQSDIWFCSLFF